MNVWPPGAAIPPMPPMIQLGDDGFAMSVEAVTHLARAGSERAVKALADAGIEWDRVHWTQRLPRLSRWFNQHGDPT